jgi:hypothetical protein
LGWVHLLTTLQANVGKASQPHIEKKYSEIGSKLGIVAALGAGGVGRGLKPFSTTVKYFLIHRGVLTPLAEPEFVNV